MQQQTPTNFSDFALVYGSKACGLIAAYQTLEEGWLEAIVAACNGLIMGSFLLLICLIAIKQPPGIVARVLNGEEIDDIQKKPPDER